MKFLTQMKACDVVTVRNGIVQAIKGPVAYLGYMEEFAHNCFAVDAKMFVMTLRKFKNSFKVLQKENIIVMYDDTQEIDFVPQQAEILLSTKNIRWTNNESFVKAWGIAQKFIELDFPGVRINHGYIETLSDNSIVRIATKTQDLAGIFAAVKLPASIKNVAFYNNKLWFSASPYDLVAVNSLELLFPTTDQYFTNWQDFNWTKIPEVLKERFVETEQVSFDTEGVKFIQKEKATASIENISGLGCYNGKLFGNVVKYANSYSFQDRFVAFENEQVKGVVARV